MCDKQQSTEATLRCNGCNEKNNEFTQVTNGTFYLYFCTDCLEFMQRNGMMRNVRRNPIQVFQTGTALSQ